MKAKNKNAHNYKNLQYIPTWKLRAILEHPHTQGIDGRDYGPVRHELEAILFERNNRLFEWELRKALHGFERARNEYGMSKEEVEAEKAEKLEAERQASGLIGPRIELISETKEYWKIVKPNGFSYEIVAIPPRIMAF